MNKKAYNRNISLFEGRPIHPAGATIFSQGGNAVDAACAMLAATCTMYDVLSWGGETQALVYNPNTKKVIGINALGVAPTGATSEFYKNKGFKSIKISFMGGDLTFRDVKDGILMTGPTSFSYEGNVNE